MMRTFLRTILLAAIFALATSCNKPRVIPDQTLADIFHDSYLANSYVDLHGIEVDSLMLYEPIFAKYGYTIEDLHYTINSFSKRKSARMSDVVDLAIRRLEDEADHLNEEVADLDTIDAIARRRFVQRIYFDSLLRMRKPADTSLMKRRIPIPRAGEYLVEYYYVIDSTDRNLGHRMVGYFVDSTDKRMKYYTYRYRRQMREKYSHTFTADSTAQELVLELCNLNKKPEKLHFTIEDLTVKYFLPQKEALDSLTVANFGFKLLIDGFYTPEPPADSTLYFAEPPRIE